MKARKKALEIFRFFREKSYHQTQEGLKENAKEKSLYMVEELIKESSDGCYECGGGSQYGKDFWIQVKCELEAK